MSIKKELIFGLIGSVLIITLLFFFVSQYNGNKKKSVSVNQKTTGIVLTTSEVAKHNSESDCWQIINSSVYDVTDYLAEHPGGGQIMILYCGKDATEAYDTKDGRGKPHSAQADEELLTLRLGDLNQSINLQK